MAYTEAKSMHPGEGDPARVAASAHRLGPSNSPSLTTGSMGRCAHSGVEEDVTGHHGVSGHQRQSKTGLPHIQVHEENDFGDSAGGLDCLGQTGGTSRI